MAEAAEMEVWKGIFHIGQAWALCNYVYSSAITWTCGGIVRDRV